MSDIQQLALAADPASTLKAQKERRALSGGLQERTVALRERLAVMGRAGHHLSIHANETLVHARRLVVIGRLLGQTHRALSVPVLRASALTTSALQSECHAELGRALDELIGTIDCAAGLVSQLNLFCYRSAPEYAALPLRAAVLDACTGLMPQTPLEGLRIDIRDGSVVLVWADAQRLGILLKVLLIELTHCAGLKSITARIQPEPEPGSELPRTVLLHLQARMESERTACRVESTLGMTLCRETATEIGGELRSMVDGDALHLRLRLPAAHAQALAASASNG